MTTTEDAPEFAGVVGVVVPASSRPSRATILAIVSRLALAAAVVSGVWAGLALRDPAPRVAAVALAPALVHAAAETSVGTTLADLLVGLGTTLRGSAARLQEFEVGAPDGAQAPVALRVELPSGGAAAVDRIVRALAGSGLDDVVVRSVTPVPGGTQVDLAARVSLASLAPVRDPEMTRHLAVALADAVARAGVSLQHLEVAAEAGTPVRMEARGDLATLAALVAELEERHTAPLRFISLGLRAGSDDLLDARLVFRPSIQPPSSVGGEAQ